jgi:GNAT superfamily N-acetyltransferase
MNQQLKDFSEQALICAIAGICFVFTLPEARGKGIGAAVTLAALQDTGRSSRGFSRILYGISSLSASGLPGVSSLRALRVEVRFPDQTCAMMLLFYEATS